jgi:predicted RNA-binding Zn-ribbon protein involved in translation (DUF1610 family)
MTSETNRAPWPRSEVSRCPKCGAEMDEIGGPGGCVHTVVQKIFVFVCPQCGYQERWW